MIDNAFKLDVAKLMVAAAWADGQLQNSEINVLKSLMWELGELNAEDWAEIEIYMDSPVSDEERQALENRVYNKISSSEEKEFVEYMLSKLLTSDGIVGTEEKAFLQDTKALIDGASTGLTGKLSKLMRSVIGNNKNTTPDTARETDIEDFLRNKIFYSLKQNGIDTNLSEDQARKLSFAAGLLGLVANVDKDICTNERKAAVHILQNNWDLDPQTAQAIVDVASDETTQGLDKYRLTDGFYQNTTREQRQRFMVCLFKIAAASGQASHEEIEEIRDIAVGLKLSHQDFIAAKVTLTDKQLGL
ncbi:Tellurite resistance protein [Anaerohalosphaera lusitana]|uniref:Tellurite resistance protein n=1 Tax=Anaerohalosphaera lusitana TaxID=1936003 RepID=A0A1U9NKH9_9BACT|nr:TerB family tellurite resistance protein [Anaerohalosphaera lusitana]AQT68431.1 Tellurite resistance protein [Anaerohalosphaera lusitana]